jgi:hypothetical protein
LTVDSWASLAALRSLALTAAAVQPQALEAFTQLQALTLIHIKPTPGRSPTTDEYDVPKEL